jgi:hypothetical protein
MMEIVCVFFEVESEILYLFEICLNRAMIQSVSRQTFISAVRVQSQASTCKICGGQSSNGTDFLPSASVFTC